MPAQSLVAWGTVPSTVTVSKPRYHLLGKRIFATGIRSRVPTHDVCKGDQSGDELVHIWPLSGRVSALQQRHHLSSLRSFVYALFPTNWPFAGVLHRPHLRALVFLFIFGTFFIVFLPPTHVPSLVNAPHFPGHYRPVSFEPPRSNRHRINVQRPVTRPDPHRKKDIWARRADAVRDAFLQAYNSYVDYASPYDELLPLSKAPVNTCAIFMSRYGCS